MGNIRRSLTVREITSNGCEGTEIAIPIERSSDAEMFSFNVFPNPAVDVIAINIETDVAFVQIIDIMGKVHLCNSVVEGTNRIDVGDLAYGTYKVVVMSEGVQAIETLVIGK